MSDSTDNAYATVQGTQLSHGAIADPVVYTNLANFVKHYDKIPAPMAKTFETTRLDQAGKALTYGANGQEEPGQLQFTSGHDATVIVILNGLRGVLQGWKVTFSDGSTTVFEGILLGGEPDLSESSGEIGWKWTIQASGDPVFAGPVGSRKPGKTMPPKVDPKARPQAILEVPVPAEPNPEVASGAAAAT